MYFQFKKLLRVTIGVALLALFATFAMAETGSYQSRTNFLAESFGTAEPQSDVIWFDKELRAMATDILGHPPEMLRMRYWYQGARTAWVIDEVGKEKPITLGVVVEDGQIHTLRVLQFRESRGWEIRFPFFTEQFASLGLNDSGALNQRIDGITGATLSVKAAKRTATLALVLDEHLRRKNQTAKRTR